MNTTKKNNIITSCLMTSEFIILFSAMLSLRRMITDFLSFFLDTNVYKKVVEVDMQKFFVLVVGYQLHLRIWDDSFLTYFF